MRGVIHLVAVSLFLTGCSHKPYGRLCPGEVSTLNGKVTGHSSAWVFDEIQHFSVTHKSNTVNSGYLKSADPSLYVPSATTAEGFMAQRLSPDRFRLIDAEQNEMVTWNCPTHAVTP
ncbi:hypothetical protein [Rosenbergiella australiborealis]|uniref:Lipoprotein n=1 Tax=Rosenbergiella australiborealis TaxID=1544696 RepID=A0ABS5T2K4_9GAMM|nr:hypothetical protein [Rosenbergiella australiborealis]MBT0726564.1 hypothetical protein [Rosenbergiella australiborealis]